ncbi:MAG TPA: helix-turn-helix transcriptional regulator [Gemmatimonadales bacterium]|jgi:transcriptional regulator with XRE-family HTH domain|nr:helix-turn-helix transcriptional regulator [Gemmatimonadales bacterium]
MPPSLPSALRAALRAGPGTQRKLAAEAGISPALLTRMLNGERAVTPAVAEALAEAFTRWSERCAAGAEAIRRATREARRMP